MSAISRYLLKTGFFFYLPEAVFYSVGRWDINKLTSEMKSTHKMWLRNGRINHLRPSMTHSSQISGQMLIIEYSRFGDSTVRKKRLYAVTASYFVAKLTVRGFLGSQETHTPRKIKYPPFSLTEGSGYFHGRRAWFCAFLSRLPEAFHAYKWYA